MEEGELMVLFFFSPLRSVGMSHLSFYALTMLTLEGGHFFPLLVIKAKVCNAKHKKDWLIRKN